VGLVWTVPVVAAAVAAGLVAARARALEEAGRQLALEVARLGELRWSLAALRASVRETDARVAAFRDRHAVAVAEDDDEAEAAGAGPDDGDGPADGG
jgi:uncharacterized protein involved in exopolysaccharide biosynthesis